MSMYSRSRKYLSEQSCEVSALSVFSRLTGSFSGINATIVKSFLNLINVILYVIGYVCIVGCLSSVSVYANVFSRIFKCNASVAYVCDCKFWTPWGSSFLILGGGTFANVFHYFSSPRLYF